MSSGIYNRYTGYHNRTSIRVRGYDYSQPGNYFITICIHDRRQTIFGDIADGKMVLNDAGACAQECLSDIPNHFPHVALDQNIVMPNHVHAIITIRGSAGSIVPIDGGQMDAGVHDCAGGRKCAGVRKHVGVQNLEPLRDPDDRIVNPRNRTPRIEPRRNEYQHIIPKSLGSIVRGFKIGVTKWFRSITPGMVVWQRNYYDHIIRDDRSLFLIRTYIRENPLHWAHDTENHIDNEIDEFDMEEVRSGP